MGKITLRKVGPQDEELFRREHERLNGEGFNFAYKYDPQQPFRVYLDFLRSCEERKSLDGDDVPATFLLGENRQGEIVGRISIRHRLNDFLARIGGHVGYGILNEFRRQGYGTELLHAAKNYIKEYLGLEKILVTCDDDNIGSIKIIENNGGLFERMYEGPETTVKKRRYWITL